MLLLLLFYGGGLFVYYFLTKQLTSTENMRHGTSKSEYQQVLLGFFFKALSAVDANLCIIISTTACVVFKQTIHCNWIVTRMKRIKAVERTLTTER